MVLHLRAELKVGTGDQPVSWQGPSLAVSQEKLAYPPQRIRIVWEFLPGAASVAPPQLCLSPALPPPLRLSVTTPVSSFWPADFSNDTWKQDFPLRVTSPPALLGRVWKNRVAWY